MNSIKFTKKDKQAFASLQNQGAIGKRALFVMQYLFLREDFRKLIQDLRKKYNIPKDGFNVKEKLQDNEFCNKYIAHPYFNGEIIFNTRLNIAGLIWGRDKEPLNYINKCGILNYMPRMDFAKLFVIAVVEEYLLFNDFIGLYKNSLATTILATYDEKIELRFDVPISIKKDELIDYISSTWNDVEYARKNVLTKKDKVRFKAKSSFFRDIQILNKYIELENLSIEQRKEHGIKYIELAVINQLKKEGMQNIPSDGTIRSTVSRLKNQIKDKSAYWHEDEKNDPKEINIELIPF